MHDRLPIRRLLPAALAGLLLAGCGGVAPQVVKRPSIVPPPHAAKIIQRPLFPKPAPETAAPVPQESLPASLVPRPVPPEVADPIGDLIGEAEPIDPGRRALEVAREFLGVPYAFGGTSPRGFDCSGLVYYAFRQVGVTLPRTSGEQYRSVQLIDIEQLAPGDLLFFRISRQRISHVGIYEAGDLFIHAPSNGKEVSHASLRDPYWQKRLVGAGRIVR